MEKLNKDGFFINLILKRIQGCPAVDRWFGQIPVAFRQRLLLCFLGHVLHPKHLCIKGLQPQLPSGPGGKSPFQHPCQVVLQPLPLLLSRARELLMGVNSPGKQVPQVDLGGQIQTLKKQQSCLCILMKMESCSLGVNCIY